MNNAGIEPGQRFRSPDGLMWEVEAMAHTHDALPHVRLLSERDPTAIKVVSVNALLDRRLFSFVGHKDDT